MSTNIAQLRANDPAAYSKLIAEQAARIRSAIPAPPTPTSAPATPAPAPTPGPVASPAPAPSSGFPNYTFNPSTPAPPTPKDMSGYKPAQPTNTFGFPSVPQSNPTPAPAPTGLTRNGNTVSGQLTPEQMSVFMSLPPEARNNYLMGLAGMPGTSTPGMPPQTNVPTPRTGYPTMTPEQIKAEVAAKIAEETARRATAAQQAKQGIQTSYDRLRTNIGEDRVLENVQNQRMLNPFSGRSDYAQGQIARERARTDREQSADLQTRLANIDVSLQDYLNSTPEQQRAMENELIRQERDYALQTDKYNYQQQRDSKLDAINADNTAYNRTQDKIQNDRNAANDALALRKQHIDEANYYSDKYGITVEPKDNFQEVINQVKGLPTVAQQTAAQKAEDTKRSEAWKRVDQFGYVPSQADADLLGVPVGTQSEKAKEAAMDAAYKDRTANIAQQNANTAAKNADTSASKPPASKQTDPMSYIPRFNDLYLSKDPYSGETKVTNPQALRSAIIALNLPDEDTDKLLLYYGIPVN